MVREFQHTKKQVTGNITASSSTIIPAAHHSHISQDDSDIEQVPVNIEKDIGHSEYRKLCKLMKENNSLLKQQLEESVKTRKLLAKLLQSSKKETTNENERPVVPADPVIYEGTNLLNLGARNMDSRRYSITLARHLWTDDELKGKMLFPRKVNSRAGLSPVRSELFLKSLKCRYHYNSDNEEEIKSAISAVNQLTSDVTRGKRLKRKLP